MTLLNARVLAKAQKKHREAAAPIQQWMDVAAAANWRSIADVRLIYPGADGVPVKVKGIGIVVATVFNIKGNNYRLITVIDYAVATIAIREFLPHAEYSKDDWKGRL